MKPKRALHLSPEEIERRCAMVDLHYWAFQRNHARTFEEWLNAQVEVDRAFTVMGYAQNGYSQLADTELVFPNVMRRFNGQNQNRMDGDDLEPDHGLHESQ